MHLANLDWQRKLAVVDKTSLKHMQVKVFLRNALSQGLKNYWVIIGDKIVETQNNTIYTPRHPSIQIWGDCFFPQVAQLNSGTILRTGDGEGKASF